MNMKFKRERGIRSGEKHRSPLKKTTTQDHIEAIKRACGAALGYEDPTFIQDTGYSLTHVLLAIRHTKKWYTWHEGNTLVPYQIVEIWNLREDSLDKQSDPTVAFIHSLLK